MATLNYKTANGWFQENLPNGADWGWLYLNYLNQPGVTDVNISSPTGNLLMKSGGTVTASEASYSAWSGGTTTIGAGGGGTTPTGGTPPGTPPPLDVEEQYDPYTAYRQRLGIGTKNYLTPAERYQESMFSPIETLRNLGSRLSTVMPDKYPTSEGFTAYAEPFITGGANVYSRMRQTLSDLFGMTPELRATAGATYEPTYEGGQRVSDTLNTGSDKELAALLSGGLRRSMGTSGANWLANRLPQEQQRWANVNAGGGQPGAFLDYYKRRYNLG